MTVAEVNEIWKKNGKIWFRWWQQKWSVRMKATHTHRHRLARRIIRNRDKNAKIPSFAFPAKLFLYISSANGETHRMHCQGNIHNVLKNHLFQLERFAFHSLMKISTKKKDERNERIRKIQSVSLPSCEWIWLVYESLKLECSKDNCNLCTRFFFLFWREKLFAHLHRSCYHKSIEVSINCKFLYSSWRLKVLMKRWGGKRNHCLRLAGKKWRHQIIDYCDLHSIGMSVYAMWQLRSCHWLACNPFTARTRYSHWIIKLVFGSA